MNEPLAQPDSPGLWNFEGYINYARNADPCRIVRMAVRVFWGTITQGWQTVDERGGRRPARMLIGKWVLSREVTV